MSAPKLITSKFRGTCRVCQTLYPAGEPIMWSRETGGVHEACSGATPALTPAPKAPKAQGTRTERASGALGKASVELQGLIDGIRNADQVHATMMHLVDALAFHTQEYETRAQDIANGQARKDVTQSARDSMAKALDNLIASAIALSTFRTRQLALIRGAEQR